MSPTGDHQPPVAGCHRSATSCRPSAIGCKQQTTRVVLHTNRNTQCSHNIGSPDAGSPTAGHRPVGTDHQSPVADSRRGVRVGGWGVPTRAPDQTIVGQPRPATMRSMILLLHPKLLPRSISADQTLQPDSCNSCTACRCMTSVAGCLLAATGRPVHVVGRQLVCLYPAADC